MAMETFIPSTLVRRIRDSSTRPPDTAGLSIISLGLGEADFATPVPIVDSMVEALRAGYTRYGDSRGDLELREVLAERVSSIAGTPYGPDQITVTHGATCGITSAIMAVANAGDRIVIPSPTYSLYADAAYMAGAVPVFVPIKDDYHLDLERLEPALQGARMLTLCNPCNPTGAVCTYDELRHLAELIRRTGVLVLADEAYSELIYDGREFVSMLRFPEIRDQVLYCQTFSKTYAMTGWRIGYIAGTAEITTAITLLNVTYNGALNPAVQRAALTAARIGPELTAPMRSAFETRRVLMMEQARTIERLEVRPPEGAFYLYSRYDLDVPSQELRQRLLDNGVGVRAGAEYGPEGEYHVRFSFATSEADIIEGMRRTRTVFEQLAHRKGAVS